MPADARAAQVAAEAGVWLAVARADELPESAIDGLSPEERAYAEGPVRAGRRRQFVGGRFLLRALLEQRTGLPGRSHRIRIGDNGKPGCESGFAISISHSRHIIVCAIAAAGDVGVDIECGNPDRDWQRLARHYFPANENAWLATRAVDEYCKHWVLREAWLKMRGTGIAGGLGSLECRIVPPVIKASFADGASSCLSLFACPEAFVGLSTDRVDHRDAVLLSWSQASRMLVPATDSTRIAGNRLL